MKVHYPVPCSKLNYLSCKMLQDWSSNYYLDGEENMAWELALNDLYKLNLEEKIKEEIIHKEIDLIQNCISRMANNSFMVKGWAVTISVASFAFLSFKREIVLPLCIFIFGIIMALWYLDAFFSTNRKKI